MRKGFSGLIAAMVLWSLSNATALAVSATSSTSRAFVHEILPAKFGGTLTRQWAAGVGRTQTAPSIAPKTAPACTGGWNQVASPTTGSGADALNATAAVSATDIWAAGVSLDTSTTPNRDQTLFEHWDGSAWSVVPSQSLTNGGAKADNDLNAVAAVSSTNVWAVGSFVNAGDIRQPLIDNWNGTTWTPSSLPSQGGGNNDLFGVTAIAANDVWAVGYWRPDNTSARQALAWHWNGTAWSASFPPGAGSPDYSFSLFGVSASAGNNVIAVGRYLYIPTGVSYAIIDRWDGSSWTETIPTYAYPYQILFGVHVLSSSEAWAVGFEDDSPGAPDHTFIWHMTAGGWVKVPSQNVVGSTQHPNNELFSVVATSATNAWAVGAAYGPFNAAGQPSSAQTLIGHWDGTSWAASPSSDASGLDELNGVVGLSATNAWAVGDAVIGTSDRTLTENLCIVPPTITGINPSAGPIAGGNQVTITGTAFASASSVRFGSTAASSFTVTSNTSITATVPAGAAGTVDVLVTNAAGQSPVTAADQYSYVPPPTVTSISPTSGPEAGGTPVTITGTNFTSDATVSFGGFPAASVVVNSATSISASSPAHCPGTVDVSVTAAGGTSPASPADQFTFIGDLCAAVSTVQYGLTGSDGVTWTDIDSTRLSITLTPNVSSRAILSGNADLWTSSAGYNQDLAITVNSVVAGWKESGGYAGTFSPNAAFVQTVVDMTAGQSYTMTLQWKANKPDPGTIWAGAGPISGRYSPTSLTLKLVPIPSSNLVSLTSMQQYSLTGNDGNAWTEMDATNLSLPTFTAPAGGGTAMISANADLWTAKAGYNQDIGISVVDVNAVACGGGAGSLGCQPVAWKESGGFAGTFSPNAAFVQTAYAMTAGHTYQIKLQWKTNKPDAGTIFAGAGPIGGQYSPTRLTMLFYPTATPANPVDRVSTQQYHLSGNDGSAWADVDASTLNIPVSVGNQCLAILSGNVDLWTSSARFNQDIGISVNGAVVAWKESGGFAGTYSPNAAFVQIPYLLQANTSYTIGLKWKANTADAGSIWAGAGPIGTNYSPTRLSVQLEGCS